MGLLIEFLIHEEVNDKHYQGYHKQHDAECHRARNTDFAAKFGKHRREYHTCGNAEACQCHFRTHGQCHFAALEPFHNASAYGNTGHFNAAPENHEADSRQFCRCGHPFVEW